ncbi:hypothetical protein JH06_3064 [Blastocystis sp. subtype 4]|uniref:hypothetical protein n=1 Tax=Blastocystis sp. subtype 4 TaxID=944170 RepID=UPI0007120527|nr:hypothetical protein JH06_3064 [Blastocystis sp. subtype 4]KNB43114.1 hypothetical protein JH06_3064 [Blastocystis sp. subtype 4]|eukprot:XP_014526557.1 hypothetical protein JH06_3064 [Blastocystis sp. subtype 4]
MALSDSDKVKFKKWLARGELNEILNAFGEAQYKSALEYIAKKASTWAHQLEVGFVVPPKQSQKDEDHSVKSNSPGHKRVTLLASSPASSETKQKKRGCKRNLQSKDIDKQSKKTNKILVEPSFDNPVPLLPRKRVPLKMPFAEFTIGTAVRLIIPAYKEFLQKHESILSEAQRNSAYSLIEHYESIPLSIVPCKVIGIEIQTAIAEEVMSVTVHCTDGQTLSLLSIVPTSDLLQSPPHLITEEAFTTSMTHLKTLSHQFNGIVSSDRSTFSKDTKIAQVFSAHREEGDPCPMGERYEGVIYDVAEDALENPYQSIRVVWLGVSANTGKWVMDFYQLDNLCSPWELETSRIAEATPEREQIPRASYATDEQSILNLLRDPQCGPEGCSIFDDLTPLLDDPHYREVITHPMDFSTIAKHLQEGKYESAVSDKNRYDGENREQFWNDLNLIVNNEWNVSFFDL